MPMPSFVNCPSHKSPKMFYLLTKQSQNCTTCKNVTSNYKHIPLHIRQFYTCNNRTFNYILQCIYTAYVSISIYCLNIKSCCYIHEKTTKKNCNMFIDNVTNVPTLSRIKLNIAVSTSLDGVPRLAICKKKKKPQTFVLPASKRL